MESQKSTSISARGNRDSVELLISDESRSKYEQATEYQARLEKQQEEDKQKQKEAEERRIASMLANVKETPDVHPQFEVPEDDGTIAMLKRMLAILRGEKPDPIELKDLKQYFNGNCGAATDNPMDLSKISSSNANMLTTRDVAASRNVNQNAWTTATIKSNFVSESEVTAFNSVGYANTADGRTINFNVTVEMSRSFEAAFESVSFSTRFCDPLVLNVGSDVTSISDKKFRFDLDCDGNEEMISAANNGSMFLALDKNGDGKINNGSELFGAKTGDGFEELAQYDQDGNGWIDEADDIFNRLVLWTKDDKGNDVKVSLRDADVGAIYLGNARTQFSLNDDSNTTHGQVRSTGIYLKESGGAGTIQHVDLAI